MYALVVYGYYFTLVAGLLWLMLSSLMFIMSGGSFFVEVDLLCGEILNLTIPFVADMYSVMFGIIVLLISSSVMLYNGFYMDHEIFYDRFCKLVMLFVASMLFLVFIPSLLGLMVGWDGLGLTSYLLVIYYQDKRSLGSGTLTVLSNRIGDVLFFVAISLGSGISSWVFSDLAEGGASVFCGLVILGCMTKSAQIPFSAWLPAAMAAPSPVSALVHSSTLVTAGVYVLIRFSASIAGGWYLFLGLVSTLTMLMSAISAVFEPDVKKVVALSTLSQLGVMMLAISMGAVVVGYFHMVSHALFKALMFLCVGAVIHYSGIQDLRYLGGFMYSSPMIMAWMVVACLSLMGFPFLSGFYSKDLVLESFLVSSGSAVLLILVTLSTCLTAFYSGLVLYSVMRFSNSASFMSSMAANQYVIIPCSILGVGGLLGGVIMQSFFLRFNTLFYVQGMYKVIPISCVILGLCGLFMYILVVDFSDTIKTAVMSDLGYLSYIGGCFADMFAKMWFFPLLSSDLFSDNILFLARDVKDLIEDGHMEHSLGSEGVWGESSGWSGYYMGSQYDYMGVCFVKGLCIILLVSLLLVLM